ncbi:MAG: hypothetical protein M1824_001454 [Vezdaea acicularis]|nr:MAG: hypothetical protein M1824_001454 [Vezdaea acicularis]
MLSPASLSPASTSLTITNPLVLYRTLLAANRIAPDPSQHRLAIHLEKIYNRLKDYTPSVEYSHRLQQIGRAIGKDAKPSSARTDGLLGTLWARKERRDTLALTQVLTSQQAALTLNSPQGLLLHGDVGTGKSMLIELLASSLPHKAKRRWHFNTFMLESLAQIENLRVRDPIAKLTENDGEAEEFSLLRLARELVETSPILFLDEFQLPDRAASKILSGLFTAFFQLGGVLIATSNRMPEELAKAAGIQSIPLTYRGRESDAWGQQLGLHSSGVSGKSEGFSPGQNEFAGFLEVLKARCEVWDMEGGRDWRRREAEEEAGPGEDNIKHLNKETLGFAGLENMKSGNLGLGFEQSHHENLPQASTACSNILPKHYHLASPSPLSAVIAATLNPSDPTTPIPWRPTTLTIYKRTLPISHSHAGMALFTFADLCCRTLGPADYITIASTFHTLVLTGVPVLTWQQKNEARRLITLLDALYEARCRLFLEAAAGPDDIFFPETSSPTPKAGNRPEPIINEDQTYPETISEIQQDLTQPFRPNTSSYSPAPSGRSTPRSVLVDEDSDFGHLHTSVSAHQKPSPSFSNASAAFTGEDERFAYLRARSRLWEMCGRRWWADRPVDRVEEWWRPLPPSERAWERSKQDEAVAEAEKAWSGEERFRDGGSPFRREEKPPPVFGEWHAWGIVKWGRKAGAWGRGVEGLAERKKGESDGGR